MFKTILALFATVILLVTTVDAQPRKGIMMAADGLELTDQQIDRLEELRFEHQKEMIKKQAVVKEARLEMRMLMKETRVDEKAALAKQDRIAGLKAEIGKAKLKHRLAMRQVLTDEQLEKWMKMKRDRRHLGGRGDGFHPGCPGPHPEMGPMGPGMGHPKMGGKPGRGMWEDPMDE
jgi:Spy/CpxP family protein refolding chaperone